MNIKTQYVYPPIPDRNHDWYAQFSFHDGDDDLYGEGATEAKAVLDLMINASEWDDDGSVIEELVEMAFAHWKPLPEPPKETK